MYSPGGQISDARIIASSVTPPSDGLAVTWKNKVLVSAQGNRLTKTGGAIGWDAGAASIEKISGDGAVEFTALANNTYRALGLSYQDTSVNYKTTDWVIYLREDALFYIHESNTWYGPFGTYEIGDVFRVQRIGNTISYQRNGTMFYTSTKSSTSADLLIDASIYTPNSGQLNHVYIFNDITVAHSAARFSSHYASFNAGKTSKVKKANDKAALENKRQLLIVSSNNNGRYATYRKGPETNHQWVKTAEDPNAYDRPDTVYYLTTANFSVWQNGKEDKSTNAVNYERMAFDAKAFIAKLDRTEQSVDGFVKVSHGTPSNPIAIDSEVWSYVYDSNGNVDTITSSNGSTVYTYDALNRLTEDTRPTQSTETIDYDRNGNRTGKTIDAITDTYNYIANSNKLNTDPVGLVTHDLAGNRISDQAGNRTFEYNNAGRLWKVYTGGQLTATYTYNAQGQRTRKVTSSGTTIYHYDLSGTLLSETTETGAPIRDYVHMNGVPVAQIDTNGTIDTVSYLHTDHLGTPRRATNEAGDVVWSWDSDAFGQTAANDDPDSDGNSTIINLRFAGQYFDQETKLHYNYFRYYDPSTGRYITSDPIGLAGGLNTYGYVDSNPTNWVDPFGLVKCLSESECKKLLEKIYKKYSLLNNELSKYDPVLDAKGGFEMAFGSKITKPGGHYNEIKDLQRGLKRDITRYKNFCSNDDSGGPTGFSPVPREIDSAASDYIEVPPGIEPQRPRPSPFTGSSPNSTPLPPAWYMLPLAPFIFIFGS